MQLTLRLTGPRPLHLKHGGNPPTKAPPRLQTLTHSMDPARRMRGDCSAVFIARQQANE